MKVSELMDPLIGSVREETPLCEATRLMWQDDVGCLPVVGAWRQVVGLLTDRDAALCAWLERRPLEELRVAHCMSRRVHAVAADDELEQATAAMRRHRVRRLPVVDEWGRLEGLVSLDQLARVAEELGAGERMRLALELSSTLCALAEPRDRSRELREELAGCAD